MMANQNRPTKKQDKTTKPFAHTQREIEILNRAHMRMMENINAGMRYDVVKRMWVKHDPS